MENVTQFVINIGVLLKFHWTYLSVIN